MSHQSLFRGSISPSSTPSRVRSLTVAGTALFLALASQAAFAATASSVALSFSDTTITAGRVETLTAKVTSTTGSGQNVVTVNVAPGLVSFYDGSNTTVPTLLGTAAVSSTGTAAIKVTLGVGTHRIQAVFAGTTTYATSSSANISTNSVAVSANANYVVNTGVLSQTDATHLLYTGTFYGSPTPGGSVVFTDRSANNGNGTTLGTVNINSSMMSPAFDASRTVTAGVNTAGAMQTATGDFNNDGIADIAISNSNINSVSVLLGNGDGTFKTQVAYATAYGSYGVVVGDFNADGHQDLAVANMSGTVSVLINSAGAGANAGKFLAGVNYTVGSTSNPVPYGLAVADVNNDGVQDLVVANYIESSVSVLLGHKTTGGLAAGTFDAAVTTNVGTGNGHQGPYAVAVADIDGDGNQDLIVPLAYDGTVEVLFGTGAAAFPTPVVVSPSPSGVANNGPIPYALTLGDFDGDGHVDAAIVNVNANSVTILQNTATSDGAHARTLSVYNTVAVGNLPTSVAVLPNYDGLNHESLAVTNNTDKTITILNGAGTLNFTATTLPVGNSPYYSLSVGDFNGDGKSDLVVANLGGNVVGVQLGTQTAIVPLMHNLTNGHSIRARYNNDNGDAYTDSANSNTIVAQ